MHKRSAVISEEDIIQKGYADSAHHALPFAICTIDKALNVIWANKNFHELISPSSQSPTGNALLSLASGDRLKIREMLSGRSDNDDIKLNTVAQEYQILSFSAIHRVFDEYATFLVSPRRPLDQILDQALGTFQKIYGLSTAELSIAKLLATGIATHQIAEVRNVSIATVRAQLRHLREKMEASTSMEVVIKIYTACLKMS